MKKVINNFKGLPKKTQVILLAILCVIVIMICVLVSLLFFKPEPKTSKDNDQSNNVIENKVSSDEATEMYNNVTKDCSGALVFDLKEGDKVEIDNINDYSSACKTNDYYSKMIGYTYDREGNVIIHVNVLKKVNNKLYDLNDNEVADFSEDTVKESLNKGTTYEYVYKEENDSYRLIEIKLMK